MSLKVDGNSIIIERDEILDGMDDEDIVYSPSDFLIFNGILFKTWSDFAKLIANYIKKYINNKKVSASATVHKPDSHLPDCVILTCGNATFKYIIPEREEITNPEREEMTFIMFTGNSIVGYPQVMKSMNDIMVSIAQLIPYAIGR